MGWIRDFSTQEGHLPPARNIEDAPQEMRQELVDLFFTLVEQNPGRFSEQHIHRVAGQSIGVGVSANPYGGYRYAVGRDIRGVAWPRVYDLIVRLGLEFAQRGLGPAYRAGVNRILAAHGAAWDLGEDGHLHRVLPVEAAALVRAAFAELSDLRYTPALALFNSARDAYDDRPRRDRDACSNVFDAMESVAKETNGLPTATFGQVLAHIRQRQSLNDQTLGILDAVNTLRNRNFGHGMTAPFSLTPSEVDFTYLTCIGAILLFTRTP